MRFRFSEFISQIFLRFFADYGNRGKRSRLVNLGWRSLPTIFATIVAIPIVHFGALQPIEFWAYNNFTNWRGDRPWDDRVVIVAIDDVSISKIGRFPWKRDHYVTLLQKLRQAQANVIGFDILWSETSPEDQQLAEAIGQSQSVVLAMAWDTLGQTLLPINAINNSGVTVGHILKREDVDGIVRQIDLQIKDIPSLSISMLQTYNLTAEVRVPLPDLSQPLSINWIKKAKDIPQFSFSDVINGTIPPETFQNKIVLVGVTASGIDNLATPFDRNPPASGVHLHTMALQNLLQKNSLSIVKSQDVWSFALLGSLLISLILPRRSLWIGSIGAFISSGLWLLIAFLAFSTNYWIAIAIPILIFLLTGFAITMQERFQMQRSLDVADAQIQYDSSHDRLTGLFNRNLIESRLQNLLDRQDFPTQASSIYTFDNTYLLAVIWIHLGRFKTINDTFGHPIGNLLLIKFGQYLKSSVQPTASIARFEGAEFVILLENLSCEQEAIDISDRILKRLAEPFIIQGNEITTDANIGIKFQQIALNISSDHNSLVSPEIILTDADTAMFYAQKLGNSTIEVFDTSMRERILKRLQLEKDLRKAVTLCQDLNNYDNQEFLIYYQPILSLQDMQIVGLEALIRWRHPERGLVAPDLFIPLAEETGLIIPIGDWIMRNACLQLKYWHQHFTKAKDITVSVNLSCKQLEQNDVLEKCLNILKQTNLSPQYLKIELTESSIMENPNFAVEMLKKMRQAGLQIYIDDFGTGYSSLAYLHKLPFDGLKIDRSFVNNIHSDTSGAEILHAIVTLAQSVKAHIVAEGIENLDQLKYLQDLLKEEGDGQGYFLFRPLDVSAIEAILQTT